MQGCGHRDAQATQTKVGYVGEKEELSKGDMHAVST